MDQIKSKTGSLSKSRREFIENAGVTAVMTAFGLSFFTSCSEAEDQNPAGMPPPVQGGNTPPPKPAEPTGIVIAGNTIQIDLAIKKELAAVGGWLLVIESQTLIVNLGESYGALTSVCTHSACDRNWTFSNSKFKCTCHGSEFDTAGKVLRGPAILPLKPFGTALSGTILTVTK